MTEQEADRAQPPITAAQGSPASGPTGHPRVDAAIAGLEEVASLASRDQVAAYAATHQVLHETLRTIEER
jgi:hypothetical protein